MSLGDISDGAQMEAAVDFRVGRAAAASVCSLGTLLDRTSVRVHEAIEAIGKARRM